MATKLKAGAKATTVKKTVAKAPAKKTTTKATVVKAGAKVVSAAVSAVTGGALKIGGKKTGGFRHKLSAKQKLKKAYDRRAIRNIRIGNLGQARRDLRKKATVV